MAGVRKDVVGLLDEGKFQGGEEPGETRHMEADLELFNFGEDEEEVSYDEEEFDRHTASFFRSGEFELFRDYFTVKKTKHPETNNMVATKEGRKEEMEEKETGQRMAVLRRVLGTASREWGFQNGFLLQALQQTITAVNSAKRAFTTGNKVLRHYQLWRQSSLPSSPRFEFSENLDDTDTLQNLLLYHCIYQSSASSRSVGANLVWLLFHLARLKLGLEVDEYPIDSIDSKDSVLSTESKRSINPSSMGSVDGLGSSELLGDWLLRLNFELDAFLHVVFDCKVLNRTVLQHHDINALAGNPEFVFRCIWKATNKDALARESEYDQSNAVTFSPSTLVAAPSISFSTFKISFSLVELFLQPELPSSLTRFPVLFTLHGMDPFYVRTTLTASGFSHLPNQFYSLTEDQKKHFSEFTTTVNSTGPSLGLTFSSPQLSPEQLWSSLIAESQEIARDWKVYNDQNGGIFGFRCYNTVLSTIFPVVLFIATLLGFCAWWTFGFNFRSGDLGLIFCLVGVLIYCFFVSVFWPPTFTKRVHALGGVVCARIDSLVDVEKTAKLYEKGNFWLVGLWVLIIGFLFLVLRWVAFEHLRPATVDLLRNTFEKDPGLSVFRVILHWLPALIIILVVTQFVYCFFAALFSFGIAYGVGLTQFHSWREMTRNNLERALRRYTGYCLEIGDPNEQEIAGALIWNHILDELYMRDMLSSVEKDNLSFELNERGDPIEEPNECSGRMLLNQEIVRWPKLENPPSIQRAQKNLLLFIRNCLVSTVPSSGNIAEMASVCRALPVGAREPIYPSWAELTTMQNTGTTVLRHLLQLYGDEFDCFKDRLWPKQEGDIENVDFAAENLLVNNLLANVKNRALKRKPIFNDIPEKIKLDICIWASMRTVCTFRNLFAHSGANRSLYLVARLQNPSEEAETMARLVNSKLRFVVGFQGYKDPVVQKIRAVIQRARVGKTGAGGAKNHFTWMLGQLDVGMRTDYNVDTAAEPTQSMTVQPMGISMRDINKAIRSHNTARVGKIEFVYQSQTPDGAWWSKVVDTEEKVGAEVAPIDGPFSGVGFGKSWNQNFMAPFLTTSEIIWTLDVNQDIYPGQPFFLPCALKNFDDPSVHLVAVQDEFMNEDWNAIAFASSLSNRTFSSIANRMMALVGIRFHYGHSDLLRASYAMGSSGLSQINILSEDVTLGMDIALKGGRIAYCDYLGVPKSKDTDILSMTKFERKVAGGSPQISCSYLWWQLCTAPHFGAFTWRNPIRGLMNVLRRMSMYYTLCGWYVNHTVIAASVFILFFSLIILETMDQIHIVSEYSKDLAAVFLYWHIGTILIIPGLIQLVVDYGWQGVGLFIKRFFPCAAIGLFHVLNTALYYQKGTIKAPVYRFSGRGDGLSHVGLKAQWDAFKGTHFTFGIFFMVCGFVFLGFDNPLQLILVVFIPAWVWMSGCIFLDQGTIGVDMRLRDWKQLFVVDLFELLVVIRNFWNSRKETYKAGSVGKSWFVRARMRVWSIVGGLKDLLLSFNLFFVLLFAYTPGVFVMLVRLICYVVRKTWEKLVPAKIEQVEQTADSTEEEDEDEEEEVLEEEAPRLNLNKGMISFSALSAAIASVDLATTTRSNRRKRAPWDEEAFNLLAQTPKSTAKTPRTVAQSTHIMLISQKRSPGGTSFSASSTIPVGPRSIRQSQGDSSPSAAATVSMNIARQRTPVTPTKAQVVLAAQELHHQQQEHQNAEEESSIEESV